MKAGACFAAFISFANIASVASRTRWSFFLIDIFQLTAWDIFARLGRPVNRLEHFNVWILRVPTRKTPNVTLLRDLFRVKSHNESQNAPAKTLLQRALLILLLFVYWKFNKKNICSTFFSLVERANVSRCRLKNLHIRVKLTGVSFRWHCKRFSVNLYWVGLKLLCNI